LDNNATLQVLDLNGNGITDDIDYIVPDRLGVNKLALKVTAWIVSAAAKVAEVPFYLGLPPGFAERERRHARVGRRASGADRRKTTACGARRAGALSRRPTYCRAPRPLCFPSCSVWPSIKRRAFTS
jgi:hypothetical protein